MTGLAYVLAIALLPVSGSVAGSLLAESIAVASRHVGGALHCAAGIAIAVISIELLPLAIQTTPPYALFAALALYLD